VERGDVSVQTDPIDMFDPPGARQCEPLFTRPRYEPTLEAGLSDYNYFLHGSFVLLFFLQNFAHIVASGCAAVKTKGRKRRRTRMLPAKRQRNQKSAPQFSRKRRSIQDSPNENEAIDDLILGKWFIGFPRAL
jgi:hypothetical protein